MNMRLFGAAFLVLGCGGAGFIMASSVRREIKLLQQLQKVLLYITCELNYRQTSLPRLLGEIGQKESGILGRFFRDVTEELEKYSASEAYWAFLSAMERGKELPGTVKQCLYEMGKGMGSFDLDGQLQQIDAVTKHTQQLLQEQLSHKDARTRNYQTLGFCLGGILAIMMI